MALLVLVFWTVGPFPSYKQTRLNVRRRFHFCSNSSKRTKMPLMPRYPPTPLGYTFLVLRRMNWDRVGAYASTICAVHCLITGVALGLLSFAGLGFLGSTTTDIAFLSVAVGIASIAIVHGMRKHHSYRPALIFVAGLVSVVLGHFVLKHEHKAGGELHLEDILSTVFSVTGGLCFVLFHIVNLRLQKSCGCQHCARGE
jgi:hypothetical protein